ncbi:hypothetical protein MCOR27_001046 [Pyricularia oryzae]|nr:hypothetical protein MCOR19_002126 [Pyricularia oryzae]KAI6277630.1 hypothetical protein MCOR26_005021 [Pyricularia oryzae]KAI6288021.1 hypothetical protein MCOR27_001046 [Pyricularia oryzae]KAI6329678.1 hypothetical protein MCOR30_005429 [Pyricularia oryzae]KAI6331646.1 hypothetical protein MCOR29_001588 [Pyricularia oryzae]
MHMPWLSSILLAASCSAALVPRDAAQAEQFRTLIGHDLPTVESFARIPLPEVRVMTAEEIVDWGGAATDAPPGNLTVERRDILGGVDDRVKKLDTGYPWSAMGRITILAPGRTTWCSGSLVGPRHLLTARHCILDGAAFVFSPAYASGDRLRTTYATHVLHLPGKEKQPTGWCDFSEDWAILRLNDDLGYGYLGYKLVEDAMSGADLDWWTYGYPQDRDGGQVPYAQNRFKIKKVGTCNGDPATPLDSTADAFGGQSGSPVWIPESGGRYQYGVLVAITAQSTLISNGPALLNGIIATRRDWP